MFYYNGKILKSYPRKDIKEKIQGLKGDYFKLIDEEPEYNEISQQLVKGEIKTTEELYNDLEHIKIAYQEYTVEDLTEEQANNNLDRKFGQWIDSIYPNWKRNKNLALSLKRDNGKKDDADAWIEWELQQRELLEEKKINKDYEFNFKNFE